MENGGSGKAAHVREFIAVNDAVILLEGAMAVGATPWSRIVERLA